MLITQRLLTPNPYSRPHDPAKGTPRLMKEIRGIAIHWVENPGTSAEFNRRWFEMRKTGKHGYGSAHVLIDDVEIIQDIPDEELAFHVGPQSKATDLAKERFGPYANDYLLGIELCHPTADGHFTEKVLVQAASVCAIWCLRYGLDPEADIVRHHDITGKDCPLWFVENYSDWIDFKNAVAQITELFA